MKTDLHGMKLGNSASNIKISEATTKRTPPLKLEEMGFELTHNRQARNKRKGKYNSVTLLSSTWWST
jgi:hypothetical protein